MTLRFLSFAFALFSATLATAQTPSAGGLAPPVAPAVISRDTNGQATVRATRLSSAMSFDGRLDEDVYKTIQPFGDFIQQDPLEGAGATDRTDVWVFYDDADLYVAARLYESEPGRRVANEMRRDSYNLYNNDHFAVGLDTFNDRRNGYGFFVNSLGGLSDSQVINEQPNLNWNTLWDARTADFDGGWTVEIRIPFRSIRFKEGGDVWGINFRRLVRWNNESTYLTAVPRSWGRRGMAKISSSGSLVGLQTPSKQRNFDLKGYALGSAVTNRLAKPPVDNDGSTEFGADAKWALSQSVVADFTYNTDFAQVEDDEAQVNLTRFSLFFPEKREFFLEGQDYFSFGAGSGIVSGGGGPGGGGGGPGGGAGNNPAPLMFYSRRIGLANGAPVPILGGGRLLGRGGGFQVGALHMRTDDTPLAGAEATDFSVVRVNRDVLRRSRIGAIATRRAPGASTAAAGTAYGVDAAFNFFTDLSMTGYWARVDHGGDAQRDSSYRSAINWNADRYGMEVEHLYVGDDFNPDIGLVRRSAFRRSYGQGRFSPRPAGLKGVRRLTFEGSLDYYENTSGRRESREAQGTFRIELNTSDQVGAELTDALEYLDAPFAIAPGVIVPIGEYRFRQVQATWFMSGARRVAGFVRIAAGEFYGGTKRELSWRGRVELSPRLSLEPQISLNHVDTPFGAGDTNVVASRATFTLTPRMFVGALLQYQSAAKSVSSNVRFRWEYQPGSELFVVYSDARDSDDVRFPPSILNRSVVVKLTKLFRF